MDSSQSTEMGISQSEYEGDRELSSETGEGNPNQGRTKKIHRRKKPRYYVLREEDREEWLTRVDETRLFILSLPKSEQKVPKHIKRIAWDMVRDLDVFDKLDNMAQIILDKGGELVSSLEMEGKMIQLTDQIREELQADKIRWRATFKLIDKVSEMTITPLMLKKNPRVLYYFRWLLLFGENVPESIIEDGEEDLFKVGSKVLRRKAYKVYRKFMGLFYTPPGYSFMTFFRALVTSYQEEGDDLPHMSAIMLSDDPADFYHRAEPMYNSNAIEEIPSSSPRDDDTGSPSLSE